MPASGNHGAYRFAARSSSRTQSPRDRRRGSLAQEFRPDGGLTRMSRIARSMERTAHACGDEEYRRPVGELESAFREGVAWVRATATETYRTTAPVT